MEISHDHTDFGPGIPFLGSGGLFLRFEFLKVTNFLHIYKISDLKVTKQN
jgi:hypothetical protein